MGQKAHPKSLRLGIIQDWDSTWYAGGNSGDYAKNVKEDFLIRKHVTKQLKNASISRVEIDRKAQRLIIRVVTGRPGVVVGRGGQGLETLKKDLQKVTGRKDIQIDVLEVARVDADAQLISEGIAQQLEKREPFRRTMKRAIDRTMRSGVKGIKIMISGRLGGTDIARTEWAREGRIPLHTFRADIEYGFTEAKTIFGIIGVKVWVFKGEIMPGERAIANVRQRSQEENMGGGGEGQVLQGAGRRPGGGGRGKRRSSAPVKTYTDKSVTEGVQPKPEQ